VTFLFGTYESAFCRRDDRQPLSGFWFVEPVSRCGVGSVQQAVTTSGATVTDTILNHIAAVNMGAQPLGSIGAVVGATLDSVDYDLASKLSATPPPASTTHATPPSAEKFHSGFCDQKLHWTSQG